MAKHPVEPKVVSSDALAPGYNWARQIPAPGHSAVDFEERVDFPRLHDWRLGRARQALADSQLGSILCFDNNNIRYLTSTVIGEWSRDKMCRYALLAGDGDPHIWDFGSAAVHHRLHSPWLGHGCVHAGMVGLRGTVQGGTGACCWPTDLTGRLDDPVGAPAASGFHRGAAATTRAMAKLERRRQFGVSGHCRARRPV